MLHTLKLSHIWFSFCADVNIFVSLLLFIMRLWVLLGMFETKDILPVFVNNSFHWRFGGRGWFLLCFPQHHKSVQLNSGQETCLTMLCSCTLLLTNSYDHFQASWGEEMSFHASCGVTLVWHSVTTTLVFISIHFSTSLYSI